MRFVVDASVAVKWFVREKTGNEKANHLLYLFREERIGLVEPELFLIEIGNALRRLAGEQKITYDEADENWADLLELAIPTVPDRDLALVGIPLAIKHRGGGADSVYVALALREGARLITTDARSINTFGHLECMTHLDSLKL